MQTFQNVNLHPQGPDREIAGSLPSVPQDAELLTNEAAGDLPTKTEEPKVVEKVPGWRNCSLEEAMRLAAYHGFDGPSWLSDSF